VFEVVFLDQISAKAGVFLPRNEKLRYLVSTKMRKSTAEIVKVIVKPNVNS